MKAVILAGGIGKRMRPYTKTTPKPMLLLGKKPILEHIIKWTTKAGIRDIVLCVSYMHKSIERYFGDGSKLGVNIEYAITDRPMSTAGQLRSASKLVDSTFVCVYGDSIFDHSLRAMIMQHTRTRAAITIATSRHTTQIPYGVIRTTSKGGVTAWDEKPETVSLINAGCYVLEPAVFSLIARNRPVGMDQTVRKAILQKMKVMSYVMRQDFIDVGNVESYKAARARFNAKSRRGRT